MPGKPITRKDWPSSGPHRKLLEYYDRIHVENLSPSLMEIAKDTRLGLQKARIHVMLTGKRLPVDEKQAEMLARALGGGDDEAKRAKDLFKKAHADRFNRKQDQAQIANSEDREDNAVEPPAEIVNAEMVDAGTTDDELDCFSDLLAAAVDNQWRKAATDRRLLETEALPIRWHRCDKPIAGPPAEAIKIRADGSSFRSLPGIDHVAVSQLEQGDRQTLHEIYGGLASGRLIITGNAGSGKSSAAILLLLDTLHYRDEFSVEERRQIPVPVMFTLHDWNPATTPVADWIVGKLAEIPSFRGRRGRRYARQLLQAKRVAVFLDGFDEMPEIHRSMALRALSQQAKFRLVLVGRPDELKIAANHGTLPSAAAIELDPLTSTDAAEYLLGHLPMPEPAPWANLVAALTSNPDSAIAQALTSPLDITLLRDVYSNEAQSHLGAVDKLLDTNRFPDAEAITNHLLDYAVFAAYTPRPGETPPTETRETAQRSLAFIARRLSEDQISEFSWWTISKWAPKTARVVISAVLGTLFGGLAFAVMTLIANGFAVNVATVLKYALRYGTTYGLPAGLAAGLAFDFTSYRANKPASITTPGRLGLWVKFRDVRLLCVALLLGMATALAGGLVFYPGVGNLSASTFVITFALTLGLAAKQFGGALPRALKLVSPRQLRSVRRLSTALAFGMGLGIANGVFGGLSMVLQGKGLMPSLEVTLRASIMVGSMAVLGTWITGAFTNSPDSGDTKTTTPVEAWRSELVFWLTIASIVGLAAGLNEGVSEGITWGLTSGHGDKIVGDLAAGLAMGLTSGVILSKTWMTTVAQIYLTSRYRTPLGFNRFLEECRERHLLRTVGPNYQFRHITLQYRLASGHNDDCTSNGAA